MNILDVGLNGVLVYSPTVFTDKRGLFLESFSKRFFDFDFVQDNQSMSDYGVLRGLHYQQSPYEQTKLVRVVQGAIWDVVVDIRPNSNTFKKWFGIKLSGDNFKQILVPKGFAHGFVALEPETIVCYKVDNFYNRESERVIKWDDPNIGIDWLIDHSNMILSDKDAQAPLLKDTIK